MWRYRWSKRRERFHTWVAWRVPKWLAYWCAIRVIANGTTGPHANQVVPELTAMEALERWGDTP